MHAKSIHRRTPKLPDGCQIRAVSDAGRVRISDHLGQEFTVQIPLEQVPRYRRALPGVTAPCGATIPNEE